MAIKNPIYSGVKVKGEIIDLLQKMVKGDKFYRKDIAQQMELLHKLNYDISRLYDIQAPALDFNPQYQNCYNRRSKTIVVVNTSIISFLHEYRHHLQNIKGKKYTDMTIEQDARAWSLRLFSKAFPKMFIKSVKENRVSHIKWNGRKVVDNASYI